MTPGYEVAVAAALGSAADALAVASPGAAAGAIRHLREADAGRATLLIAPAAPALPGQASAGPGSGDGGGDGAEAGSKSATGTATGPATGGAVPRPAPSRDGDLPAFAAHLSAGPGGSASAAQVPAPAPAPGNGPAGAPVPAAGLVGGDAELLRAVGWVLRDHVVVASLDEAEALVAERPDAVAVTLDGDVLGAHLAHGGSAGAPSLIEVQAAVDEAAAELTLLGVRCEELGEAQAAARARGQDAAALVDELADRRRAAEQARAGVAQQLGRLAGQAKGAAGEAERSAAAAAKAQDALEQALAEVAECAERLATAEEMPVDEEPDGSRRDRLAADGANARQTEMEARLQLRTHEERVRALAGRADSLDRGARAEREARARAERRRARLRHEAEVAGAVADGSRQLLAHVEVSLRRADEERERAERAKGLAERSSAKRATAAGS